MGKNRGNKNLGTILGFLLGPIGLLILLTMPTVESATANRSGKTSEKNGPCPCGSGKNFKHCCMKKA